MGLEGSAVREHKKVPGRKPLLEFELPKVYASLAKFPLRDQTLVTLTAASIIEGWARQSKSTVPHKASSH